MKITRKQIVNLPRHELFKLANHLKNLVRNHCDSMSAADLTRAHTSLDIVRRRHGQVKRSFYKNMSYSGIKYPRCPPRRNDWGDYRKARDLTHAQCAEIAKNHTAMLKGPPVIYTRS